MRASSIACWQTESWPPYCGPHHSCIRRRSNELGFHRRRVMTFPIYLAVWDWLSHSDLFCRLAPTVVCTLFIFVSRNSAPCASCNHWTSIGETWSRTKSTSGFDRGAPSRKAMLDTRGIPRQVLSRSSQAFEKPTNRVGAPGS